MNVPIRAKGITFPTSEHYYQWQKYNDPIIRQRIISAATPDLALQYGQKYSYLMVPNFDKTKAMLNALRAKFSQHPDLANALVQTGSRPLIYHNMYDSFWADGGDGTGHNMLGQLLMQVRTELQQGKWKTPFFG